MSVKTGDTVRFLNAVGGGTVTRIDNGMAYVEDFDGFETPVLLRECVVVLAANDARATASVSDKVRQPVAQQYDAPTPKAAAREVLPVVEVPGGDVINVVLGFEPQNIKALSTSNFDAYLVNDSNYWLYACISAGAGTPGEVTALFDGIVEPNMQILAFELENVAVGSLRTLDVKLIAFKRGKSYAPVAPVDMTLKVDAVKFAKLHCFRANSYFDGPVLAWDIVRGGHPAVPFEPDADSITRAMRSKDAPQPKRQPHSAEKPSDGPLVVDLHASELLDTTAGLSNADILNCQIDRFRAVMDQNLRHPGLKIIFIHGKGEGVLRQALYKELTHRYKGHDVQDASFREYGFGATQVTIKNFPRK